jgi:hypothetical protein
VRKTLLFISISSCIFILSCSQIPSSEATKEQILKDFRSSIEYQQYRNSDQFFAQVITTFRAEQSGMKISTMNSGETQAFEEFALKRNLKVQKVFSRLNKESVITEQKLEILSPLKVPPIE